MGFYNFYFIKQFFNYLRKNKKFIIFFIVLVLLLFIRSTCFAVGLRSFSFTYNNQVTDVTLPDDSKYNYIIFWTTNSTQADSGQFRFYCSSQPLKFKWLYANYDGNLRLTAENNATIYYGTFYNSRYSDTSKRNTFTTSNQAVQWDRGINDYIASNDTIPIYNYNNVLVDSYAGALPPESYANLPYFLNSESDIALGEQDLVIMPGDFPNSKIINFQLLENNPEEIGAGGIQNVWTTMFNLALNNTSNFYRPVDNTGVGFYYVIPWSYLSNYLSVTKEYDYRLSYTINNETITDDLYVTYGGLTPEDAIKNSIANQSNLIREQNANQEIIINQNSEIIEQQQATTGAINDLNDNITDPNIDNDIIDLPTIDVNDPTYNFLDTLFTSFYNAFCTGEAPDVVFPIPNTR